MNDAVMVGQQADQPHSVSISFWRGMGSHDHLLASHFLAEKHNEKHEKRNMRPLPSTFVETLGDDWAWLVSFHVEVW